MSKEDDKKNNVIQLFKEATTPIKPRTPRKKTTSPTIQVNGNHAQIAGRDINHHHTEKVINKTVVKPQQGIEHINEGQVAELHRLKDEIIRLENIIKKSPITYQGIWSALNKHMRVGAMRMIPIEKFPKAQKYLREWIGRLNSMASAPNKDEDEWRKRKYAYIKINSKNDTETIKAYMLKNFEATSLTKLSNDELEKVYRYVASRKNKS
jgi:hypothetical protein